MFVVRETKICEKDAVVMATFADANSGACSRWSPPTVALAAKNRKFRAASHRAHEQSIKQYSAIATNMLLHALPTMAPVCAKSTRHVIYSQLLERR